MIVGEHNAYDMSVEEANRELARRGYRPISGGSGEDDASGDESASGEADGNDAGNQSGENKSRSYSEADVESIVKKRLARERAKIASDVKSELESAAALDKAKKDGDLQKIIDAQKVDLDKFTTLQPILEEYEQLAEERYKTALAKLPEALKILAPDDEATALDKERWLTKKALPALAKLNGAEEGKAKRGNNPADPEPVSQTSKKTIDDMIKAYSGRGSYKPLL